MIQRFRHTAVAVVAVVGLALTPTAAQAAKDTTAPTVSVPARAGFVVGSTIGPMALHPEGHPDATWDIRMSARIQARDASGICGYRSRLTLAGGPPGAWSAWQSSPFGSGCVTPSASHGRDSSYHGSLQMSDTLVRQECYPRLCFFVFDVPQKHAFITVIGCQKGSVCRECESCGITHTPCECVEMRAVPPIKEANTGFIFI